MNIASRNSTKHPIGKTLLAFCALLFLCGVARAQVTYNYNPDDTTISGTDLWSTSVDWTPSTPASGNNTTLDYIFTGTNTGVLSNINDNDLGDFQLNSLILGGTGSSTAAANASIVTQDGTLEFQDSGALLAPVLTLSAINGTGGTVFYQVNSAVLLDDNLTINGSGNAAFAIGGVISSSGAFGLNLNTSNTLVLTAANTYTGSTTITSGTLQLGDGTASHDGSIASTAGVLNNSALVYNRFGAVAAGYNISGVGTLTMEGSGTQTLSGTNTYSGATNIASGVLQAGSTTGLSGSSAFVIATPGVLDLNTFNSSIGSLAGSGTVTNSGGSLATLSLGGNNTITNFSGVMQNGAGGLALTKVGTGKFTLSGANSFTGTTTLAGGVLNLGSAGALGGGGNVTFAGGTLQYSASNTSDLSGLIVSSGSAISIDVNGQTVTYASSLAASNTGGFTLIGTGGGRLVFNAANAYTGTTTLTSGTLELGVTGALGGGGNITFNGGTLQYSAGNQTDHSARIFNSTSAISLDVNGQTVTYASALDASNTGGLTLRATGGGTLILTAANAYTGTTTIISGTLQLGVGVSGSDGTIAGTPAVVNSGALVFDRFGTVTAGYNISGVGTVTMEGSGTQILNGTNTYSGATNIISGVLQAGSITALSGSSAFTVGASGVLDLNTFNNSIGSLTGSGTVTNSGGSLAILTTGGNNTITNFSGNIQNGAGGLALTKSGTGTFTLSGSDNFTGTTTLAGGALNLGSANALAGAGSITFSGGTLQYSVSNTSDLSGLIVSSGSAISIDVNGQTVTYASALAASNTGGFTLKGTGGGTLIFNAANAYTGTTTLTSGTLQLGVAGALGGGGNITFKGGTLQYSAGNQTDHSARILSSTSAISLDLNGQTVTYASALDASNTGGLTLRATGGGTLILTAANAYTGTTTITSGTLQLGDGTSGHDGTIAGSPAIVDNSALVYDRFGTASFSGVISGNGTLSVIGTGTQILIGTNTVSGSTNIGAGATLQLGNGTNGNDGTLANSLHIGNAGTLVYDRFSAATYGGVISGTGNVSVIGTGTQILTGANTYSGTTSISGGATMQLGDGTAGHDGTIGTSLTLVDNGTLAYDRSGSSTYSGTISGTGVITMFGTGTQSLTGSNTYSGSTIITGGALLVNSTTLVSGTSNLGSLGAAGLVINGGLFGFTTGTNTITNNYTLGAAGSGFDSVNAADKLTLSGNLTASTLTIAGAGATAITGSLTGSGTSDLIVSILGTGTTTDSGTVANGGGFGLQKAGPGILLLTAPVGNTYSGTTTITGGILLIAGTSDLGTLGGAGLVINGGLFGFVSGTNTFSNNLALGAAGSGFDSVNASDILTLSGNISGTTMNVAGAGATTLTGTLTGSSLGDLIITIAGTGTTTISGTVVNGGGFGVQKAGAGALALSSTSNSYSGSTTLNAGTLLITGSNSLGTLGYAGLAFNSGTFGFVSGTNTLSQNFTLNGTASGFIAVNTTDVLNLTGSLSGSNANFTGSGTTNVSNAIVGTGTSPLTIFVSGSGITDVTGTVNNGALGVIKTGTGTLLYNSAEGYSGSTAVVNGILAIGPSGTLNSATPVILGGAGTSGTLQLGYSGGPANLTLASLTEAAGAGGADVVGGNITTGTLTINTNITGTYAGAIGAAGTNQNNVALVVTGTGGNLNLNGLSTFTGGLVIENGTVSGTIAANFGASTPGVTFGDANTTSNGATLVLLHSGTYANNFTTTAASGTNPLTINVDFATTTLSGTFNLSNNLKVNVFATTVISGSLNLNSGGNLIVAPNNNTATISGNITGPGNIIINGTGATDSVAFNQGPTPGNGGWTGELIINSGTVTQAGSQNPYNVNVTIVVNSGASFGGVAGTGNTFPAIAGFADGANGGGTLTFNRGFTVAGSGTYSFSGNINNLTAGNIFNKDGLGTQILSGSNLVQAATNVNAGTLKLSNPTNSGTSAAHSLSGNGSLTLVVGTGAAFATTTSAGPATTFASSNNATLQITGNYLIGATNAATVNIKGGNGTTVSQGALSLQDSQINTLVINSTAAAGTTILTMGSTTAASPSVFSVDLGSTSDQVIVGAGGVDKVTINTNTTEGVLVNVNGLSGLTGATQTILQSANTGVFTTGTAGAGTNFALGTTTGNFGGYTVALSSTAAGLLQLTETPGIAASSGSAFYWTGSQGNGSWNSFSGGNANNSNWSLSASGAPDAQAAPGVLNDVNFSATGASNLSTTLGQNQSIKGIIFTTTGGAVTIGGTNTLTLGVDGITIQAGAANPTITAKVALGGNQTWSLNNPSSLPFVVSGNVADTSNNLTVAGGGELVLSGSNTFSSGTLTISGAIVGLNNASALGGSPAVAFAASSSGTLDLGGNNASIGSLSSGATPGTQVIESSSATPVLLTGSQTTSGTYAGVITNGGAGAVSFTQNGPAALTLTGSNSYTGSTTLNAGTLNVNGYLGGAGAVTVNSGATLSGSGGTINGAVTVNSGGTINPIVGPGAATMTLTNGLTISGSGIAAFDIAPDGSSHDQINITSGGLTLASGAILQVTTGVYVAGNYVLMTYTGPDPSLAGVVEETLASGSMSSNYSIVASSGTLELIVAPTPLAIPGITLNPPASARVMANTTLSITGTVTNSGTANTLSGTLSNGGGTLTVSGFSPAVATVPANSGAVGISGSTSTGASLGTQTYAVTVTDGSATPVTQTGSGSVDVVANRVVSASGTVNLGFVHVNQFVSGTATLVTTGSDNQYTEVLVSSTLGPDGNSISLTGGNTSLVYNSPTSTDTRVISGYYYWQWQPERDVHAHNDQQRKWRGRPCGRIGHQCACGLHRHGLLRPGDVGRPCRRQHRMVNRHQLGERRRRPGGARTFGRI